MLPGPPGGIVGELGGVGVRGLDRVEAFRPMLTDEIGATGEDRPASRAIRLPFPPPGEGDAAEETEEEAGHGSGSEERTARQT